MTPEEPSPTRLVVTLSMAGLIAGLVLAGVYLATKPRIEQNRAEALERAVLEVLPGATHFETIALEQGRLVPVADPSAAPRGSVVYAAKDAEGRPVGYAVPAEGPGFMDTIGILYGFDPSRRVIVGMHVLDSRETPGLGDKIITDAAFRRNFEALAVEPAIVPVKKGEKTRPNEVDTITGATISAKAVVSILNQSMERWRPVLVSAEAQGGDS
jgi:Na+-translocating ferredoxin:NAD+ oxidoreductase subunit G